MRRLPLDPYLLALLATVLVATVLPARGVGATVAAHASTVAVGLLFFLYGAKIAPRTALAGARHWRLHLVVLATTFGLFPLLVLTLRAVAPGLLPATLYTGLVFLAVVPSTVQSAIAFTSMAHGNVPAAVFTATLSNLAGVLVTPLLAAALLTGTGQVGVSAGSVTRLVGTLLVPFAAGQLLRPWLAGWVQRHKRILDPVDRGSILIVVYTAFSAGLVAGVWRQVSPGRVLLLAVVLAVLFGLALAATALAGRAFGLPRPDRVATMFCGTNKSMASGLPMAAVLFTPGTVAMAILPLMLYHQLQLVVCALLARRWAGSAESS
jgi:sodium/bile acid cotransporter 7